MANLNLTPGTGMTITVDADTKTITASGKAASTIQAGTTQLATADETTAGTVDNKAVTAAAFKNILNKAIAPSKLEGTLQVYRTSGSFSAPKAGRYLFIATGGGGGSQTATIGCASGGGGAVVSGVIDLEENENIGIIVGAAGSYGQNGGNTQVQYGASSLVANGGSTGYAPNAGSSTPGAGGTFTVTGTDFKNVDAYAGSAGKSRNSGSPYLDIIGGLAGNANSARHQGQGSTTNGTNNTNSQYVPAQPGSVIIIY